MHPAASPRDLRRVETNSIPEEVDTNENEINQPKEGTIEEVQCDGITLKIINIYPSLNMEEFQVNDLINWGFDPFVYSKASLVNASFTIFEYFDLISEFELNVDIFTRFLNQVCINYRVCSTFVFLIYFRTMNIIIFIMGLAFYMVHL